ncbi:MAG: hypothetical protein IPG64_24955 [Haliea sp.]|nr:hypothetical protein [Haliea sp.]
MPTSVAVRPPYVRLALVSSAPAPGMADLERRSGGTPVAGARCNFLAVATTTPEAAVLQATLEASQFDAVEVQEAELLLDEDLDLYLWLIGDAKAT